MTRKLIACALVLLAGAALAHAGEFPGKATYLFYINGKYAGKSVIKTKVTAKSVVFESTSKLAWDEYAHDFACVTEVDKESLGPRRFTFDGVKMKKRFFGSIEVRKDSAFADFHLDEAKYSSKSYIGPKAAFVEGYVPEHAMVLARILMGTEDPYFRFTTFLPSDFMTASTLALMESEAIVPATPPLACRKYSISPQNSGAYLMFVDPKTARLVYMAFPTSRTEVFLVEAFGEEPTPIFQPLEDLEAQGEEDE